jgi:hypothetical protein
VGATRLGAERDLGYPISDEKPTKTGSANRYNDFENGVVYWKSGASSATVLSKNVLASKTFAQMKSLITTEVKKRLPSKVDGHSIYVTNICVCGPEPM